MRIPTMYSSLVDINHPHTNKTVARLEKAFRIRYMGSLNKERDRLLRKDTLTEEEEAWFDSIERKIKDNR